MAMKNVRMSRKNHPMPIVDNPQRKGRYTGAEKCSEPLVVPKKHRPFEVYDVTPPPMDNEEPVRGEGRTFPRRRDKNSSK